MSALTRMFSKPRHTLHRIRRYVTARRDLSHRLKETRSQGLEPILVYQMGKVGSKTLETALTDAGFFTLHVHRLGQSSTPLSENWPPSDQHLINSNFIRANLLDGSPLRIVTGIRDPIARNISAFFQNLWKFGCSPHGLTEADVPTLISAFLEHFPHSEPAEWFDRELRDCLGMDVFAHVFSGDHATLEDRHSVLILKTEADDAGKTTALQRFVGRDVALRRENVGAQKGYAGVYRAFVERIRLDDAYLDSQYDTKYCRHFYTEAEIAAFRRKWRPQ